MLSKTCTAVFIYDTWQVQALQNCQHMARNQQNMNVSSLKTVVGGLQMVSHSIILGSATQPALKYG